MNVLNPLRDALANFLAFLPQLVFFLVILIVGFIIAKVAGAGVWRGDHGSR